MVDGEISSKVNLLLVDGHSSNFSANFNNKAKEKNLLIMCFPPNLTHILQPLDALYLKKEIRKNLPKFHITKKWDVLAALKSPFYHASEESIIKNSF